jgi:hypothetical protein
MNRLFSMIKAQLYDVCTVMNCLLGTGSAYSAIPNLSIAIIELCAGLYKKAIRLQHGYTIQSEAI